VFRTDFFVNLDTPHCCAGQFADSQRFLMPLYLPYEPQGAMPAAALHELAPQGPGQSHLGYHRHQTGKSCQFSPTQLTLSRVRWIARAGASPANRALGQSWINRLHRAPKISADTSARVLERAT